MSNLFTVIEWFCKYEIFIVPLQKIRAGNALVVRVFPKALPIHYEVVIIFMICSFTKPPLMIVLNVEK